MGYTIKNIPTNWEIKPMPEVVKWGSGGTPKATVREYYENGDIPWLIIGDLNDSIVTSSATKITELGLQNSSAKIIEEGTLMVAMYGSIGKLGITGMRCCTNQAIAYAKELHGVTTKYMFYYMAMIKSELISKGKGGTQKNISQTVLNSLIVAYPPSINEQERIVAKIEELFSDLDNAVETLNDTKTQLEVYRQAVYASIYDYNNVRPITDFFEVTGGLTKNSKRNTLPKKMPYLRVANVYFNMLDLSEIKEIGVNEQEIEKCLLKKNDLLFVEGNGSKSQIGRVAIWDGSIENCLHQNHLIKARPLGNMIPAYALFYLISGGGRKQINEVSKSTSGLYTLSTNKVRELMIPYCDYEKQQQGVDEIESRLSVCKSIEETVDTALQQATAMRQSILKQAFEGRLL
jgi:restriction modification system DNA specificity protein